MNILVTMPKGYIRDSFLGAPVSDELSQIGTVIWNETESQWSEEELAQKIGNIDVCITGWGTPKFNSQILSHANCLKLLVHTGGTVSTIVCPELYDRGIRVVSGNDGFARSVSEGVIAYMLLGLRRLPSFIQELKETQWRDPNYWNEGLLDQTVGIVGYGNVAKYLIPMLKAFNARIKVYSNHLSDEQAKAVGVEKASLEDILHTCKIVSLHCASNEKNYHLINKDRLELMQTGSILVNTSRGDIVDEEALVQVCSEREIIAVLDVYENEDPVPKSSRLWGHENIIMIPHMCGPTVDQRRVIGMRLVNEIRMFFGSGMLTMEIDEKAASRMTKQK